LRREKQLVKDVAEFLVLSQIPGFVSTFDILLKLAIESLFVFNIDVIICRFFHKVEPHKSNIIIMNGVSTTSGNLIEFEIPAGNTGNLGFNCSSCMFFAIIDKNDMRSYSLTTIQLLA